MVEALYESIRARGEIRGVDIDSLLREAKFKGYPTKYQGLVMVDTMNLAGRARWHREGKGKESYMETSIEIHPEGLKDLNKAETTIAHEIGHLLEIEHCHKFCDSIMSGFLAAGVPHTSRYIKFFETDFSEERWDRFFNKVKKHYNIE